VCRHLPGDDLWEGNCLACVELLDELLPELIAVELRVGHAQFFNDLLVIRLRRAVTRRGTIGHRPHRPEEVAEVVKVRLRPLIERMLVALSALNANAKERVSKCD